MISSLEAKNMFFLFNPMLNETMSDIRDMTHSLKRKEHRLWRPRTHVLFV